MKKAIMILLLTFSFPAFSQTFNVTDSVFRTGSCCRAQGVLFELGKATLRSESYPYLDSVVTMLNTHPALQLEVDVHSDSRAKNISCGGNLTMSRAKSICDYLVSKGVTGKRLKAVGYGSTKPLISDKEINKLKTKDEQEAAYQKNRRIEFKIISS